MTWIRSLNVEDMVCEGACGRIIFANGTRLGTATAARGLGWTVIEEATLGGGHMSVHMCPDCAQRPRPIKVERLEGEVPLWET